MAGDTEGFVIPIYADDGGTLAIIGARLDALAEKTRNVTTALNRMENPSQYKRGNSQSTQNTYDLRGSSFSTRARLGDTVLPDKELNRWEAELKHARQMVKEFESLTSNAQLGGIKNVLAETTRELLKLEKLQGPEMEFRRMALAAEKARSAMKLYTGDEAKLTRSNLLQISTLKARVDLETRASEAQAKSTQNYRDSEAAVLRLESAGRLRNSQLKQELALEEELAKVGALSTDSAIGKQKQITAAKTLLSLNEQLAKAESTNSTIGRDLLTRINNQNKLNDALRIQLDLDRKLNSARIMNEPGNFQVRVSTVQTQTPADTLLALEKKRVAQSTLNSGAGQRLQREIAEQERLNVELQTELDLKKKLEEVTAAATPAARGLATEIRDQQRLNMEYEHQQALLDRIEKAKVAVKSVATARTAIAEEGVYQREITEQKKLEEIKTKVAEANARTTDAYRQEEAELNRINRAEMEHVETQKLINKLYQEKAVILALSSEAYHREASGLAAVTDEQRVAAETAKVLAEWQKKVAAAMAETDPAIKALKAQYAALTKEEEKLTLTGVLFSERTAGVNQVMAGFRAALSGIGMGFGIFTSGTILAATATYSFVSAMKSTLDTGMKFETEMARTSAAMQLTASQYDDLAQRAINMAKTSRYGAEEVAKAYREMAMSGFTYEETVSGLPAVLAMASIGMMDFGEAADIATNILFGFNLQATDLAHVVDVMATTITSSAQDLRQLGTTMSYVAPVASAYGISLEAVAAATEVLANAGIKGSRSGTGLRRTFTALFSDSENIHKAMKAVGVSVNMLAGDMDAELLRVLKELNKATSGATTNTYQLTKAVGIYAIPTFLNLIKAADGSVDSLEELAKKYDEVGGAAFEMQQRMEAALQVDWEKALAALSAIKNSLYEMAVPTLRESLQGFTSWLRGLADDKQILTDMIGQFKELVYTVGALAAGITALSVATRLKGAIGGVVTDYRAKTAAAANAVQLGAAANAASLAAVTGTGSVLAATAAQQAARQAEAAALTAAKDFSKKIGSMFLRSIPFVGLLFVLKDVYDIFRDLNKVTAIQEEAVNSLAQAQHRLNDALHGFKIPQAEEAKAVDVAQNKASLDMVRQRYEDMKRGAELRVAEYLTMKDMPKPAALSDAAWQALLATREKILAQANKDLIRLGEQLADAEQKYKDSGLSLVNNLAQRLTEDFAVVMAKVEQARKLKEELSKEASKPYSPTEAAKGPLQGAESQQQAINMARTAYYTQRQLDSSMAGALGGTEMLDQVETFYEYLDRMDPKLSELAKSLDEASKGYDDATEASDSLTRSVVDQFEKLDQARKGMNDMAGATKTLSDAAKSQKDKLEAFFKSVADVETTLSEEARIKMMSDAEQIDYYTQKIDDFKSKVDELKANKDEIVNLTNEKDRLTSLIATGNAADGTIEKLKEINRQLEEWGKKQEYVSATFPDYQKWLDERGKAMDRFDTADNKAKDVTKAIRDLHQSLWDLFNLPNEKDFANTLKGRIDFAIAQADALLAKYARLQGDYKALPYAPAPGSWGAGSTGGKGLSASEINSRYGDTINKAATKFNLDPKLIIAVIQQESRGRPGDVSPAGAKGLMQLMDSTASRFKVSDVFDPAQNIMGGSQYLRVLLNLFKGDIPLALAGYNAGEGAVQKAGGDISRLTAETRDFVPSVLNRMSKIGDLDKQAEAQKEVNKASESAIAIDKERTQSVIDLSDALVGMAKTNEMIATSIDAQVAKEQQGYSDQDLRDLLAKENELRSKRLQLRKDLAELDKTPDNLTQEQIDNRNKLIEQDRQWVEQIGAMTEARRALQEEEIKQGKLETKLYTRTPEELKSVAEGYDSAWARSRKYYESMEKIIAAEKAGYLTHTEAMLEKINADLANMDPLTKDMATNLVQAITDVATGAAKSADAVDNLKKSLKNLVMEKFVVKIGIDLIGSITQPISVGLQGLAGSILSGVGKMLLVGLGSLAGGMANAFGSLGVDGSGNAAQAMGSTAGGLMNAASSVSNIFSVGSSLMSGTTGAFFQGAMAGFSNLFAGTYGGVGMELATAGISGGSSLGMAGGIGYMVPYLLPIAIGVGWAISKWFKDKEPRQGAFSATTFGGPQGLEDWQNGPENYSKGGFGLMFGLSDNGSKNIDASEFKELFDGLAKVTQTMEDFYGPEVSKKVEEALKKYSLENWSKDGIMRLSMDSDQALRDIINMISDAAAATGDEVAQILDSLLGTLSGTAEEIAKQLETAMNAVEGILKSTTDLRGTEIGNAFGLTGTAAENALKLVEFAKGLIETGETAVEAAQRVIGELGSLQFALDQTATSIEGLNQTQIAQLASDLADAYGSATKLAEAQAKYFQEFWSASEQADFTMKRTLSTLHDSWAKLQEKMNGLVGPKAVDIVVPELKKDLSKSLKDDSSNMGNYIADILNRLNISGAGPYMDLYSQLPLAEDQQKLIEEALLNALNNSDFAFGDQWKELYDKIKNGITPEELNKFITDMIDSGQIVGLDGFRMLLDDYTSQNLFGNKLTGKKSGMTPEEANKNATEVLKAAEYYSRGVASGAIERNLELEAKIQAAIDSYASELTAMGYDVTKGVFALADQIKNWAKTTFLSDAEQRAADNIKDPNAEIYARLISGDLPKTREEFNNLISSINLQTEAGRTLYAELMKLIDAFDAMYDAIEGFESWLGVRDEREIAKTRLVKLFDDLGLQMPKTKEALKQLYLTGKLTAEQLALLGANLEDLTNYYGNTDTWDPREDLTNATIAKLQAQLDKFNSDLATSRNIVQAASSAIENLGKASATTAETYQEDLRVRAQAALSMQRLPDDITDIINGLGNLNQQDYGSYEDYMNAVLENDSLLRQIRLRAENQVSWDEKQVKLLQEQIDLQKDAILRERVELYEKIKGLEEDLTDAYLKMQQMWDTGLGRLIQVDEAMNANVAAILSFLEHNTITEPVFPPDRTAEKTLSAVLAATKMLPISAEPTATYQYESVPVPPDEGASDTTSPLVELLYEVQKLRAETRETQVAISTQASRTATLLSRWEGDGLPPDREDYLRQIAYNTRATSEVSPCT